MHSHALPSKGSPVPLAIPVQETHTLLLETYDLGSGHSQEREVGLKTNEEKHAHVFPVVLLTTPVEFFNLSVKQIKHFLSSVMIESVGHSHLFVNSL